MSLRVDFYLLNDADVKTIWYTACRVLEKAYHRGHRVFVYCENQNDAEFLDELLWTYKEESFVPHNLQGEGPEPPPPIQIGWNLRSAIHGDTEEPNKTSTEPRGFNDIFLNMSTTIPSYFARFRRIIEIVSNNETAKEIGRAHYKEYRAHRCDLHTHIID